MGREAAGYGVRGAVRGEDAEGRGDGERAGGPPVRRRTPTGGLGRWRSRTSEPVGGPGRALEGGALRGHLAEVPRRLRSGKVAADCGGCGQGDHGQRPLQPLRHREPRERLQRHPPHERPFGEPRGHLLEEVPIGRLHEPRAELFQLHRRCHEEPRRRLPGRGRAAHLPFSAVPRETRASRTCSRTGIRG